MGAPRATHPVLLLLLAAAVAGCVERKFLIRTVPEGASVSVNGVPAGATPVEIPFSHYGTVRLEVEPYDPDGNGWADYRRLVTGHELAAPWYEWFPFDFFSDNLWPWTVVDSHEAVLVLEEAPEPESEAEIEEMKRAVGPLKERAGRQRAGAEAGEPPAKEGGE